MLYHTEIGASDTGAEMSARGIRYTEFGHSKMKKSSSVADLAVWYDKSEKEKKLNITDKNFPDNIQRARSLSVQHGLDTVVCNGEAVIYSVEQETVEVPKMQANVPCNKCMAARVIVEREIFQDCAARSSIFDAGDSLDPQHQVQKLQDASSGGARKKTPKEGVVRSPLSSCYALDPEDLIYFEELDHHSIGEEDISALSCLEISSMFDRQGSVAADECVPPREASPLDIDDVFADNDNVVVGHCAEHDLTYSFMCFTCNVWGCPSCSQDEHQVPFGSCELLKPGEDLHVFKGKYKDSARACVKRALGLKRKVCREVSAIQVISDYYKEQAAKIKAELDITVDNLNALKAFSEKSVDVNSEVSTLVRTIKDTYREVKATNTIEDILSAIQMLDKCNISLDKHSVPDQQRIPVIPNIQINKTKEIIGLLEAGAPLYCIFKRNGETTYSQLTLQDGGLLLHCLRDDVYPNDGVAILTYPFEFVCKMIPKKSKKIFLDIGWAGERRGRVYVKLFGNTARSHQVHLLCTGEMGPSYRNSVFYERSVKSFLLSSSIQEILYGGDFENNDGSGGRAIIENLTNGGLHNKTTIEGMMTGWPSHEHWRLGSFGFYLQANPDKSTDTAIGIAIQGLEILRAAAKQDPIANSYVCDCGIFIPL